MASESTRPVTQDARRSERGFGTGINALVGGVAAIVLSFVPLSPVLGGAVAGYLEGGDTNARLRVGALAGLVALVPLALIGFFVLAFLLSVGGPRVFGLLGVVFFLATALYTVGLSALGGVVGAYLEDEFDL